MKLNLFEPSLVHNPVRQGLRRATVEWLWRAAGAPELAHVLQIGCSRGDGIREIARRFRPRAIDALDVDEEQVARARSDDMGGVVLRLFAGDAERIAAADGSYDGVFAFTMLHHVLPWRAALAEIRRVLRPGGLFLFEELSRDTLFNTPVAGPLLRRLTAPPRAHMFTLAELRQGLEEAGLEVRVWHPHWVPGWVHGVAAAR